MFPKHMSRQITFRKFVVVTDDLKNEIDRLNFCHLCDSQPRFEFTLQGRLYCILAMLNCIVVFRCIEGSQQQDYQYNLQCLIYKEA
jgi:hypothetical protein